MALPWGEPVSPQITARIGGLPAECLLLCDVVYEPHLFPLLLATMAELCGPDTLILLAYRRRNPDEWQFFERLAKVRRFRYIQYYSNTDTPLCKLPLSYLYAAHLTGRGAYI